MTDEQYFAQQQSIKNEEMIDRCNAPKRHRFLASRDTSGPWQEALDKIKSRLGSGFIIGIAGIRGNGKTQLGVDAILSSIRSGKSAFYTTAMEFFSRLKDTYRRDSDTSELGLLSEMRGYRLLVIDEIGKRGETEWENNQLFELINSRYNDLKDTILVSNQDPGELEKSIGPSLASRMQETGGLMEARWESFRK